MRPPPSFTHQPCAATSGRQPCVHEEADMRRTLHGRLHEVERHQQERRCTACRNACRAVCERAICERISIGGVQREPFFASRRGHKTRCN